MPVRIYPSVKHDDLNQSGVLHLRPARFPTDAQASAWWITCIAILGYALIAALTFSHP